MGIDLRADKARRERLWGGGELSGFGLERGAVDVAHACLERIIERPIAGDPDREAPADVVEEDLWRAFRLPLGNPRDPESELAGPVAHEKEPLPIGRPEGESIVR